MATIDDVLAFWFGSAPATSSAEFGERMKRWYLGGPAEDAAIRERFGDTIERAIAGELDAWAETPRGGVALVLVLDQMTRSVFRGTRRAFAGDARAQRIAVAMLDAGTVWALAWEERHFVYMPLVHAEDAALLDRFNALFPRTLPLVPDFARPLLSDGLEQGRKYRDLIARFGRFPHRNEALGRASTAAEAEFLKTWDERRRPKEFRTLVA
jgi:uncharacterized protein (DUF924 family)